MIATRAFGMVDTSSDRRAWANDTFVSSVNDLSDPLLHVVYVAVRAWASLDGSGEISVPDVVKFVLTIFDMRYLMGGDHEL
jgi:hypothetical protein